jgi:hypothetical protein
MIGSPEPEREDTQTVEEQAEFNKIIEQVRVEAKEEALQNLSAEEEYEIAQKTLQKSGKKFLGSEGKYPFLSEAVNSDEEKLKRVSNLQQWEIEKIKLFNRLYFFLKNVGMDEFSKSVKNEMEEMTKLSTSKEGYLLNIAGTEAVISKNTQRIEEEKRK